jgi:cobalt-precorrin 5A hydrolase
MTTVVISLEKFACDAKQIAGYLEADFMEYSPGAFASAFARYDRIVAIMSAGIVVRGISPLLKDKWTDPAVVVVSPDLRYAIPISGGHHGANEMAHRLSGMGLCPVITTATESTGREAVERIASRESCDVLNRDSTRHVNASLLDSDVPLYKIDSPGIVLAGPGVSILVRKGDHVVGVGCNKGVSREEVVESIRAGLSDAGIPEDSVLVFATTVKKRYETGLLEAVQEISGNLVFIDDDTINAQTVTSQSKASAIGLQGVAEPCALALSKRKELVMKKRAYGNVTIAVAR